jgi:hypothetical protein
LKRTCWLLGIVQLLVLSVLTGSVIAEEMTPLKPIPAGVNTTITTPAPSLPQEIRDFCGEWGEGKWVSGTNKPVRLAKMFITKVSADQAEVLYGCGDSLLSPSQAFWFQGVGQFRKEDKRVVMVLVVNNSLHRFWIENGKLVGLNPLLAKITLSKVR